MKDLTLPWPARELHPNARVHWGAKARAAKLERRDACLYAFEAGWRRGQLPAEGKIALILTFCPPDRRRRDDDGMVASFKHARDGLADALGVDDSRFRIFSNVGEPVKDGAVKVRIEMEGAKP